MRRSRGAIVSTTVLSLLLIVVTPLGQLAGLNAGGPKLPTGMPFDLSDDPSEVFAQVLMPLFVAFAGLVVPSVAAVHTVVVERERRSVELLIALPVRVHDILAAKMIATLLLSAAVMVPLFLIDAAALLAFGFAGLADVAMMLLVLVASALCSVALALLVALVARDFRTANNLNGLILGPGADGRDRGDLPGSVGASAAGAGRAAGGGRGRGDGGGAPVADVRAVSGLMAVKIVRQQGRRALAVDEVVQSIEVIPGMVTPGYWPEMVPPRIGARALLLGQGGGTVARLLLALDPEVEVLAVDDDPRVTDLAAGSALFRIEDERLRLEIGDAFDLAWRLEAAGEQFDFVAIDLYRGSELSRASLARPFLRRVGALLGRQGTAAFNLPRDRRTARRLRRIGQHLRIRETRLIGLNCVVHCAQLEE